MSLDEKIPRANFPTKSGDYKYVQLDIDGEHFLHFSRNQDEMHSGLLLRVFSWCRVWDYSKITNENGSEIPALEGERYKVYGMGHANVDVDKKTISFWGESYDYKIGLSKEHLEKSASLLKSWNLEV